MKQLGNFAPCQNPVVAVVAFDATTNLPVFALAQYNFKATDDIDEIKVNGKTVPIIQRLDNVDITTTRPQSRGGLVRRTARFSVVSDIGPFALNPLSLKLYSVGANSTSLYFGIYAIDYSKYTLDFSTGMFFGFFSLDGQVRYDESTQSVNFELIDFILNQTRRVNNLDDGVEIDLVDTEWSQLMTMPMYAGYIRQAKVVGESSFVDASFGFINSPNKIVTGKFPSDWNGTGNLPLGPSPFLGLNVGAVVKIKVNATGEVIQGTIYDNAGVYELTSITRDTRFDQLWVIAHNENCADIRVRSSVDGFLNVTWDYVKEGKIYASVCAKVLLGVPYVNPIIANTFSTKRVVDKTSGGIFKLANACGNNGELSTDVGAALGLRSMVFLTDTSDFDPTVGPTNANCLSTIKVMESDPKKIPDLSCWLKGPMWFCNTAVSTVTSLTATYQMSGLQDAPGMVFNVKPAVYSASYRSTSPGLAYDISSVNNSGFAGGSTPQLQRAYFKEAVQQDMYFRDTRVSLPSPAVTQNGIWSLIITDYVNTGLAGVVTQSTFYVRVLGATDIISNPDTNRRLYYSTQNGPVQVPSHDIASITTGVTAFGITNLIKVVLNNHPSKLYNLLDEEGNTTDVANDAYLLADLGDGMKVNKLIKSLLEPILPTFLYGYPDLTAWDDATLNDSPAMSFKATTETYGELIDSILYEAGYTLEWNRYGKLVLAPTVKRNASMKLWKDGSNFTYAEPFTENVINYDDLMENSFSIQIGKLLSKIESDGSEHVPVWFDISYPVSENDGVSLKKIASTKPIRSYYKVIREEFRHLRAPEVALHGAYFLASIGHAANIGETTRIYSFKMPYDKVTVDALNIVRLKDFKYIDTQEDITAFGAPYGLNADGHVYYKYDSTSDHPFVLTHGLCVVETMTYNFGDSNDVTLSCKQVQYFVNNNLSGINVFQDSFLPAAADITQAGSDNPTIANSNINTVTQSRWGSTQTNTYKDGSSTNNGSVSNGLCCSGVSSDTPANGGTGPGRDAIETPREGVVDDNPDFLCGTGIPISIDGGYIITFAQPSGRADENKLLIDSTGCNEITVYVFITRRTTAPGINIPSQLDWQYELVPNEMCAPYNSNAGSMLLTESLFDIGSLRQPMSLGRLDVNYHMFDDPCAVGDISGETKTRNLRLNFTVSYICNESIPNGDGTFVVTARKKSWNLSLDYSIKLQKLPDITQS